MLSRWRCLRLDRNWWVVAEDGREDSSYDNYRDALKRSDELNRAEQYEIAGLAEGGAVEAQPRK